MNALANTAPIAANDQDELHIEVAITPPRPKSQEQKRLECEARHWIAQAHKQDKAWRYWLKQKLERIEEVRKHPQPGLRAEINRQGGKNG